MSVMAAGRGEACRWAVLLASIAIVAVDVIWLASMQYTCHEAVLTAMQHRQTMPTPTLNGVASAAGLRGVYPMACDIPPAPSPSPCPSPPACPVCPEPSPCPTCAVCPPIPSPKVCPAPVVCPPPTVQCPVLRCPLADTPKLVPEPSGFSPSIGEGVPAFKVLGHVPGDHLGMPGGWYALQIDHKWPAPNPEYLDRYLHKPDVPCYDLGNAIKQPLNEVYKRRHAPPTSLPGGVPRTFIRWEGKITREQFDAVPDEIRGELCLNCMQATRYQIIDGHLYRKGTPAQWAQENKPNLQYLEDLILTVLHLWDLPDMDFILHNGAGCPPNGYPVLGWNICRNYTHGGFGFPYVNIWRYALGPSQNQVYQQCMVARYNVSKRLPNIFWRGSTTDPIYGGGNVKIDIVHRMPRLVVHQLSKDDPVFDVKLNRILPDADECVTKMLQPLGIHTFLEDYAKSAIAMDIDGHGISGRFGHRLLHIGLPVLKQLSNNTGFFEHLAAPGQMIEIYNNDASDYTVQGRRMIAEYIQDKTRLLRQAEQLQGLGALVMHQVGIAEAAAYSLLTYHQRSTWKAVRDPSYTHVPFANVCKKDVNRLPRELCAEMQARPPKP